MTPERLGQLLDRHAGPLELYAAQWASQPEDPVQEAFIELTKQTVEPNNVVAWLYAVTRRRAISAARAGQRRERHERRSAGRLVEVEHKSPGTGLDAETAAAALDELPDDHREIVVARIWGGLGFEAIAELVGTSKSTVHRRYEDAIRTLRRRLGLTWLTNEVSEPTRTNRRSSSTC